MVSALDSGSSGPGSSPGRGRCVVSLGKPLNPHSTHHVYKWVSANVMPGGKPANGLASHPGGSRNIPSRFITQKAG